MKRRQRGAHPFALDADVLIDARGEAARVLISPDSELRFVN